MIAGLALALALALGLAGPVRAQSANDPLEPINRAVHDFNDAVDRAVVKPVAEAYVRHVPARLRSVVTSFFGNIDDFFTGINNLLQAKPEAAADDFGRVLVNTTLGIAGIFDVATEAGIERREEDFGQTFGRWGASPGPYLVLPFLGPSSLRDATGTALRIWADPLNHSDAGVNASLIVMKVVDQRSQLLGTETVVEQAALDKYRFLRSGYLQRRRYLVFDGAPPPVDDE